MVGAGFLPGAKCPWLPTVTPPGSSRKTRAHDQATNRELVSRPFLRAVKAIAPECEAQILNDLKASGMKLGLLVNFGSYPNAEIERRIF